MDRVHLNEHDANQGAQSRGEFLGMSGNSGWYLLGAVAASLLIVMLCWGVFGVSLLLCLFIGLCLCALSLAYVFALKNNRPEHYDSDFFESAMIESGVLPLAFGPRQRRPVNPFRGQTLSEANRAGADAGVRRATPRTVSARQEASAAERAPESPARSEPRPKSKRTVVEPVVALSAYEALRAELDVAEELLEDAFAERTEG